MSRKLKTAAELAGKRASSKVFLSYGSIDDTMRRRRPTKRTSNEVAILPAVKREIAAATARDDRRNMTILAWMVRRHLDNVSRFTPHFRISDPAKDQNPKLDKLNATVRKLLAWHSRARQFDALGKMGRDEWLRMFEACKILSGDAGGLKCAGGKLQGIEGDRITRPADAPADKAKNITEEGLTKNEDGTRKEFCLCKRTGQRGQTLSYERLVPSSEMIWDGYWPERFDADRGVSPLLTALNEGADVREVWEWLILKAKTSAVMGLGFEHAGPDPMMPAMTELGTTPPTSEAQSYSSQVAEAVKVRGIINLDLDPGDKVTEFESKTPNPQVIEFTRELIRSVLLSLDIPFTFYDSLTASFSARIADRNEYEESCEWKRDKNIGVLEQIYVGWLFPMWAEADLFGFGTALKEAGVSVEEVGATLRWVPAGRPWLDRSNEMSGHILALAAGVTSSPRICAAYGDDAYEIAAEQKEYLNKCGIPILYAQGGQFSVQSLMDNVKKEDDSKGTNQWLT
jgi:capsid protein